MDQITKQNVLFLCTGNSCRSQIGEAVLRKLAGERFEVFSAGMEPESEIHPLAVKVCEEIGLDLSGQHPKDLSDYLGRLHVNYAIVVCADAAKKCPTIWPGMAEILLWPFEDPAGFEGSEEAKLEKFREVRDLLYDKISAWLKEIS